MWPAIAATLTLSITDPSDPKARVSASAARADLARALGHRAEDAVVRYLEQHGVSVLATNLRVGRLELDVVAREGRTVIVVEVRARSAGAWTSGFGSIDAKKRMRVRRAVERLWRQRFKLDETVDRIRIDAASVTFEADTPVIAYVKAAF